jgi:Phosphotransferase enzyme family
VIAAKTTIPIPKLYAYSVARENGPYGIASFMIIEYIDGQNLNNIGFKTITGDQRQNLYVQLAKIYIQLRRLEFPAIGRLAPSPDGNRAVVRKRPMTNNINVQEVEGLQPLSVMAKYGSETGILTSAGDYISMLLCIAWNAFEKGWKNVHDEAEGCDSLYHLDQFSQFVKAKWLNHALDCGPFVLAHGDLEMYNLFVNKDLDMLAVLDWEWSHVVPLQLFIPPTWITNRPITSLSWDFFYDDYIKKLDRFRAVVRDQELKMYGEELLSKDWASIHNDAGILIGSALEIWTLIDYVAGWYLDRFLYRRKDLNGRIKQFMEVDSSRRTLIARKVADYTEYRAERKRFGLEDSSDEEEDKVTNGDGQRVKR